MQLIPFLSDMFNHAFNLIENYTLTKRDQIALSILNARLSAGYSPTDDLVKEAFVMADSFIFKGKI